MKAGRSRVQGATPRGGHAAGDVFIAAQARFLRLREAFPGTDLRGAQQRRESFNALRSAAHSLQRALAKFDLVDSLEGAQLVALLAGMPRWKSAADVQPQGIARERLARLGSDLLWLLHALEQREWPKGPVPSPSVQMWLWCAADAWSATMGEEPSSAEGSRFWRALQDFQDSAQRSDIVPKVNRDNVRSAIDARELRNRKPDGDGVE